ncbi:GH92 family glycosyl hydrolase [Ferruginibacter sp.]
MNIKDFRSVGTAGATEVNKITRCKFSSKIKWLNKELMYKSATPMRLNSITEAGLTKTIIAIAILLLCNTTVPAQKLMQYVQPLSGTAASTTISAVKHSESGGTEANANTIPAVTVPFAMTQFTAQTKQTENKCVPPYLYKDSLFSGFRATHWISGSCTQDYGSFTVMPVAGKLKTAVQEYAIPFSHTNEIATPAYYKLELLQKKIIAEVTATARCGVMRFTMLQADSLYLLITPNSDYATCTATVNASTNEVVGTNAVHRIYQGWGNKAGFDGCMYFKANKNIVASGSYIGATISNQNFTLNKKEGGVYIGFYLQKGESVELSVGTSFTSTDAAKNNYLKEIGNKNFDAVYSEATAIWEKALQQISVTTDSEKDKRKFYTALYHAMQHPRLMSDEDGAYPKFAGNYEVKQTANGNYYDDFSMWDIYRAQLPLFEILNPSLTNQLVNSVITKGEQGGWLPIFPCWNSYTAAMIGDHVTAFIASAYNKGIRNYDVNSAYALMRKNAFETPSDFNDYKNGLGRRALTSYLKYGYIPLEDSVPEAFHKKEQVSRTLEYAYDDYALSVVAKNLHKMDDYKKLQQRAFNYKNVFDASVGMVRGKFINGTWAANFNADKRASYITEGTPRQYTFYVPQDVQGLTNLLGGTKKLENALDSLFFKNEYWHGNEPGHQIPFMYNYTAAPYKTQQTVLKILDEEYSDGPGGLSGNDDAGQMSAWYVFAAMGFYPVDPVSGEYILCTPLFDKIVLQLQNNKQLQIICKRQSEKSIYIQDVKWNGKIYGKNFIRYADIMNGGSMEINLSDRFTNWGSSIKSRPSSLTK